METNVMQTIVENFLFVLEFLALVAVIFLAAYAMEKKWGARNRRETRILSTRKIAMIGMFSAISAILMVLEVPVPFAPPFYKIDLSELPALIATFAFGPAAGVMIEFCKLILKVIMKSTSTAFVGELANFTVGCSFLLPASACYLHRHNKKGAVLGAAAGTLTMTAFGTVFNAVYLIPKFSQIYGMPLDAIVAMGTAIHPSIHSVWALALLCVAPLNLVKGGLVSVITILIYQKLRPILKA